jgi:hypothetical protein
MYSSFGRRLSRALMIMVAGAVVSGCSASSEAGVVVELLADTGEASALQVELAGEPLRVADLSWVVTEIELAACSAPSARLARWLLPSAHAHGSSTPTKHAVPTLVSTSLVQPVPLGQLAPPAARYCSVRYRIAPADADTVGLARAPHMLGRSMMLEGELPGGPETRPLTFATDASFDVERGIDVELSAERPHVRLQLACAPGRWVEELGETELAGGEPSASAVLEAFSAALSVSVE